MLDQKNNWNLSSDSRGGFLLSLSLVETQHVERWWEPYRSPLQSLLMCPLGTADLFGHCRALPVLQPLRPRFFLGRPLCLRSLERRVFLGPTADLGHPWIACLTQDSL